ncbi:MAG: methyl-accepting chemotaxis protein [Bacteroidales bacterium]|nr:methyl-accepting chemotaxis protein [Bacteroidales bacterium]
MIVNIKNWITDKIKAHSNSIWGRYAKRVLSIATVLILIINWLIFYNVQSDNKQQVRQNAIEMVSLQTQYLEKIYQTHMQTMQHLFQGLNEDNMDEYMQKADKFVGEHPDDFDGYVRITFRDGRSYTSDKGLDPRNFAKYDIPRMIFYENVPFVFTSPYKTMDKVEVKHYGIHSPLKNGDSVVAVITTTIPHEAIDEPVSKLRLNGKGVPGIIHSKDMIVVFDGTSEGATINKEDFEGLGYHGLDQVLENSQRGKASGECTIGTYQAMLEGKMQEVTVYSSYIKNTDFGVSLSIVSYLQYHSVNKLMVIMMVMSIITILALYFALKLITQRVVMEPISRANSFAKDFSEGKLYSTEIDNIDSDNEFGEMKHSMSNMRDKLADVLNDIRNHANNINSESEELINLVVKIEDGAQTQAVSTEEISASIENISASVQQINDNAQGATGLSNEVAIDISRIAESSKTTLETIENVINKIKIINDITQRTDMLAINASVEAARAGKLGSGFTQVAAEIRKLAEVCQNASAEINTSSAQSLKITEYAVKLISSIEPKVKENAQMVAEISGSCIDQIELTRMMTTPIQQLVTITSNNSSNAEELSNYVDRLKDTCQSLMNSVDFFKFQKGESREELMSQMQECNKEIERLRALLTNKNTEQ